MNNQAKLVQLMDTLMEYVSGSTEFIFCGWDNVEEAKRELDSLIQPASQGEAGPCGG